MPLAFKPRRHIATALWYALFLVATCAGIWLLYSTAQVQQQERDQAADTTRTLLVLRDYNRAITAAESNQRGYLLTGDDRYWNGYRAAVAQAPANAQQVVRLPQYQADPSIRQGADRLIALGDRKLSELDNTVTMARSGHLDEAMALVRTHAGYSFMGAFRNQLEQLEQQEIRRLEVTAQKASAAGARLTPLIGALTAIMFLALIGSAWQAMRAARAESALGYLQEIKEAQERADLLARELNHRVKNIFTIVLSILRMTAREAKDPETIAEESSERILALAVAHDLWQGDKDAAIDFHQLVKTLLAPYHAEGDRLTMSGDLVTLPGKDSTSVCLILHELATNAVKYGAWSGPSGHIDVHWRCDGDKVVVSWLERGGAPIGDAQGSGFGSTMITASTRMLRGTFERDIAREGLSAKLSFPAENCVIQPYET